MGLLLSSCHVGRFVYWNVQDLNDYNKFPAFHIDKSKTPFYFPRRYKRLNKGIYMFRSRRIRRVHNLSPRNTQPKMFKWMTLARENYFRRINISRLWAMQINRLLNKSLKK